jgi:O-6-methylguanine DNA methyltransferase
MFRQSLSDQSIRTLVTHPLTDLTVETRRVGRKMEVTGIHFGIRGSSRSAIGPEHPGTRHAGIIRVLKSLLDGHGDSGNLPLDFSWCTPFQKKVLTAARAIPRGTTVTYAQLALMAGYPRAIRAVASVMRNNRFPLVVPCHRVIRSDGTIGGFMGKRDGRAIALKRRLLMAEAAVNVSPSRCH